MAVTKSKTGDGRDVPLVSFRMAGSRGRQSEVSEQSASVQVAGKQLSPATGNLAHGQVYNWEEPENRGTSRPSPVFPVRRRWR